MRTIAITLGDNDFGMTFTPLLESIWNAFEWHKGVEGSFFTEETITTCIRAGIEFHYLTFQHGNHHGQSGYGTVEGTIEYLSRIKVLFDEEAEKDIETFDHDGGAWYLELQTGKVHAY